MNKKVLHLLNSGSYSGAENVAITIIKECKKKGYIGAYASLEGSISNSLVENNIEYIPIKKMNIKNVRKIIKLFNPDIIHAHDFTASFIATLSTINVPIMSHIHNNVPWLKKLSLNSLIFLTSSFRAKKILGVSPSILNEFVFSKLISKKFLNIGNPIDSNTISEKSKMKYSNKLYDLVFIGRLTEQKNPLKFISYVKKIQIKIPNIRVALIGTGELENKCVELIEKLNLEKNIEMFGFINNPYSILDDSKVLCMTSSWEGYGLVAAESLVLGKPVIAFPVGGLPTIVNDSCGLLTNSEDEYIQEVMNLITNDHYYDVKKNNAYLRASEIANLDIYIEKIVKEYDEIFQN